MYPLRKSISSPRYALHIPPELDSLPPNPERGFREVESLVEREIETEKNGQAMLQQSYGREIRRLNMLLGQSRAKLAQLEDQESTLTKEREDLNSRIREAREQNQLLHRAPDIHNRLSKLDQVQTMQRQVQDHLRLEESRFRQEIHDQEQDRKLTFEEYKRQLQDLH
jgi:hypothetical protein